MYPVIVMSSIVDQVIFDFLSKRYCVRTSSPRRRRRLLEVEAVEGEVDLLVHLSEISPPG